MPTVVVPIANATGFDQRSMDRRALAIPSQSAVTATGTDTFVMFVGDYSTLRLTLNVTARSGTTPTLDVDVLTCDTEGGTYYVAGSFAQKTSVTSERKTFTVDRFVKLKWTISGTTPSFTFSFDNPEFV